MDTIEISDYWHWDGKLMDDLLAKGWYRSTQDMFFVDSHEFDGSGEHQLIWIRYLLEHWKFHPEVLMKRNRNFSVNMMNFLITPEIEDLFALYRSQIDFDTSYTVRGYLLGHYASNTFDTILTEIRDGSLLIATGYHDLGDESAAGILNFYHPSYKKFSLGKYLMKLQTDHSREEGKKYFYPGYVSPTYPKFDYKIIDAGATEKFIRSKEMWVPFL